MIYAVTGFDSTPRMETEKGEMHRAQEREQKTITGFPRSLKRHGRGSKTILKNEDRTWWQESILNKVKAGVAQSMKHKITTCVIANKLHFPGRKFGNKTDVCWQMRSSWYS